MKQNRQLSRSRLCLNYFSSRPSLKATALCAILVPLSLNAYQGLHIKSDLSAHHDQAQNASATQHATEHQTAETALRNGNVLTVVAVQGPTTVFQQDGFTHGFGYDLARSYAKSMDLRLELKTVKDNATALSWVKQGKAEFALTTASVAAIENARLTAVEGSCGAQPILEKYGLDTNFSWVFKSAEDPMTATASGHLCQSKNTGTLQQLASFYDQQYIKDSDLQKIDRDLQKRLPIYQASFKQSAKQHDLDWHFLAAIGYQESYLRPESVSPTGVRGVMMLTSSTAKAMGVTDRTDARQSIQGGAKYMQLMLDEFDDVPYPDRNWYALVAYNMGPGAVQGIQKRLKRQGKNPNQWVNLYNYLERNQASNGRYRQALQYVKRIRVYTEHIKQTELARL